LPVWFDFDAGYFCDRVGLSLPLRQSQKGAVRPGAGPLFIRVPLRDSEFASRRWQ